MPHFFIRLINSKAYTAFFALLGLIFMGCFLYTQWGVFYLPLYGDEPQWKMIVARLFLDGGKLLYLFPGCTQGFLLGVPMTWYPGRILDALMYADASDPFYLRQYGVMIYLGLLFSWTILCRYCTCLSWVQSFLMVSSFFMVGVLPLLMVYNRPEQSLLIWISLALLVSVALEKRPPQHRWIKIIVLIGFALLGCFISAAHPKGIYFLPVLMVLYWRVSQARWNLLGLGFIYAWTALETIALWKIRTKCPESGWLTTMLQGFTVQPKLLKSNPTLFFEMGTNNLHYWTQYLKGVTFAGSPYRYFLNPDLKLSWVGQFANDWVAMPIYAVAALIVLNAGQSLFLLYQQGRRQLTLAVLIYILLVGGLLASDTLTAWGILAIALGLVVGLVWMLINQNRSHWAIVFVMTLSLMVLMFMQSLKNFYEATLVWPIFLLIGIFTFNATSTWARNALKYGLLPLLLLLAIISTQARWDVMGNAPLSWQAARQKVLLDNLEFKQFAKEACGIEEFTSLEDNLVLDDETYPMFWRHTRPMLTAYVFGWWSQGTDYKTTFAMYEPKGLATKCNSAPAELMPYLKQTKDFCCASKEDLRAFNQANAGKTVK